ncbi:MULTISPECIES: hypothetical protein [Halorussus]|uniref:hypothetical protein n=1 Tax=Halorussus TaxID=1070314 RepID=UPI00209F1F72|nr:hypothetical protein [Halorussus vallis]USZ78466.1 hypothetical protein NGM07_24285 [Halorussus vallis]USZ78498.1 hypothetical protein NGM07_23700 [Halorussus vallis]
MAERNNNAQPNPKQEQVNIDRRSYLQTVGATGAGLALGGTGVSTLGSEPAAASLKSNDEVGFFIIDDFEDDDLSEYTFDKGSSGASIVDNPTYHGDDVLQISGTDTEMISTSGLDYYPAAGDTFRYWVRGHNGADRINLTYGVQDHQNRYFARVNPVQGSVALYRYENGSATLLADKGVSLSQDTWYEAEIAWSSTGDHTFTLSDAAGNQVAQISATDPTWSSGGVGYDAYLSDGGTVYIDYVTKGTRDPSDGCLIVDNFQDGDLNEYRFDRGSSGASVVTSPTKTGEYALEIAGTSTEMISTAGLNHYPSAGSTMSYWIRGTNGADRTNFTYGVQDHTNRYFVRVNPEQGALGLYRTENGTSTKLAGTGVALSQDTWYEVDIEWARDGTHTVTLFNSSGTQLAQISATDSTWSSGGVGYDAYLSGSEAAYFDGVTIDDLDDTGEGVIVENFEDGDLSEYSFDRGSSGASVVSSTTFDGSYALQISGTNTEMIRTSGLPKEPQTGDTFSCWVRPTDGAGSSGVANFTYGVQDHDNRYYVQLDFADGILGLVQYENGSGTFLDSDSSVNYSEGVWYEVVVEWRTNGRHVVTLRDGDDVAELSAKDTTWSTGGTGYDAYVSNGGTVHFDYVTKGKHRTPDVGKVVDDFDDGDLSEYTFDRGGSGARLVSTPPYYGSHALELSGTAVEMISTSGLPRYPEAGNQFRCRVRATGGADKINFTYGVQDHNNRYFVRVNFATDRLALYRYENETATKLAANSTGFCLAEDTWFRIEIEWETNGEHTVKLYNDSEDLLSQFTATDSTWSTGGIGYDAYLSDGGTVYFDHVLVDGLARKYDSLHDAHGKFSDMSSKTLSDNGYESRKKATVTYQDGYSYEKTVAYTGNDKYRIEDSNARYWTRRTPEAINQTTMALERTEAQNE